MRASLIFLAVVSCSVGPIRGEPTPAPDKSLFTLWHPTPPTLRRAYKTDRPSKTDSPYTIDAGVFQIETDAANLTLDRQNPEHADVEVRTVLIGQTNLKIGLTNYVDLQLIRQGYVNRRTSGADFGVTQEIDGFGDTTMRLKVNLAGNDKGPFAFALIPFVKIPTNTNGLANTLWEPGLVLPAAVTLPGGLSLFAQTRMDILRHGPGSRRLLSSNSIGVSRAIAGNLSGYAEFFSTVSTGRHHPWSATADFGLVYQISPNMSVDVNSFFGLTRSAEDLNVTVGMARRF